MKYHEENKKDWYEGYFKEDKFEGKGIVQYKNGDKFQGHFQNGKEHGEGLYLYATKLLKRRLYEHGVLIHEW